MEKFGTAMKVLGVCALLGLLLLLSPVFVALGAIVAGIVELLLPIIVIAFIIAIIYVVISERKTY